ncbi:MAG: acetyl-CoA carboxylase biotin carboxylase subunit, partial [Fibrobacterota bacterium]
NFELARNEARTAFNDPDVYMEKYIVNPRHVEVQFMADSHGDVVHFGERDCSVQRRHQKLVEESPSPAIADNEEERKRLCGMVVKGISSVGYEGAGTMEFLRDADGTYYFMEVNTRIQVEHPVSEFVTGTDLIKEMLPVAMGEKISVKQKDVKVKGHSIECRINAEDPYHDFRPSPGIITDLFLPGGPNVRVDTHVYNGYAIPPYYDSMVAKLITHGRDRDEALAVMSRCLDEFVIEGVQTTIPFHKEVMKNPVFRSGDFNTGFLEENKIL